MMEFKIHNSLIGDNHPLFFIAEAGVNHNGSVELGKKLIDIASDAGADAVKFQTFKTENIITPDAPKSSYHIETTGTDQSWYDLLKTQELTENMHLELIDYCSKKQIIFLSTPYDEESANLLEKLCVPAYKIASTDTNNTPFLRFVARKGKPMIISTAMVTMEEVEEALNAVQDVGLKNIAVLQCTGNYPAKLSDSNLRVIQTYQQKLNIIVGYSDHTPNLINPVAATAMGAKVYEKHFTIDKSLPGPDHRMSLDSEELKQTVKAIRDTELAMGNSEKKILEGERENRRKLQKSIIAIKNMVKGEVITKKSIAIMRPQTGIAPRLLSSILGKNITCNIQKHTPIKKQDIEWR